MAYKDLDEIILEVINQIGYIRRKSLFEEVKKQNKEVSSTTFNRAINRLSKLKEIITLTKKEYTRLGIFDKDNRATYLTTCRIGNKIKHYDQVLQLLNSEKDIEKKNALLEIESMMENVLLTPAQLSKLSNYLLKENIKISESIIRIIYNNILERINFPSDLDKFQESIIDFLEKYDRKGISNNTKAYIIAILGILNNEIIIDFIKKEIKQYNQDFEAINSQGYTVWTVANIIEEYSDDIFNFQNSLNDEKLSLTIFQLRKRAQENLIYYKEHYPKFKIKLMELEK
jgi:hypothetical protein